MEMIGFEIEVMIEIKAQELEQDLEEEDSGLNWED